MIVFNGSETQFHHLSTLYNLPYIENTQLKPSPVHNILSISFIRSLAWKEHFISLFKQASKNLNVMKNLQNFFTPHYLHFVWVLFDPVCYGLHITDVFPPTNGKIKSKKSQI